MEPADATHSIDQGAAKARFRVLKYGFQTLLIVVVVVGGFTAAYRAGLDRGYKDGDSRWGSAIL